MTLKLWKRFVVKKDERAVLWQEGDFVRVLAPGVHRLFDPFDRYVCTHYLVTSGRLNDNRLCDYLFASATDVLAAHFVAMELGEKEVGLRYENEVLVEVLPPASRRLYWQAGPAQRLEKIDISQSHDLAPELADRLFRASLSGQLRGDGIKGVALDVVEEGYVGLLKKNGKVEAVLSPGMTGCWKFGTVVEVTKVDTRLQALEISGQEILSRDKVSLRLNLGVTWKYSDPYLAFSLNKQPADYLYRELQFGLRAAVGTRTLDELLENKQIIDQIVHQHIQSKLPGSGLEVLSVGVKDIILPGEMKTILAQVVEAEKAAQANVIRRREETAATRSLLNTAKVMEDNPTALRLKELETLERIAERIDKISVFGGLDQVLNGLVKIGNGK